MIQFCRDSLSLPVVEHRTMINYNKWNCFMIPTSFALLNWNIYHTNISFFFSEPDDGGGARRGIPKILQFAFSSTADSTLLLLSHSRNHRKPVPELSKICVTLMGSLAPAAYYVIYLGFPATHRESSRVSPSTADCRSIFVDIIVCAQRRH